MDDEQLLRYSRHILLPQLGVEGQQKLLRAHVLIIGAGGLGCPAARYLAGAGTGRITVCDHDDIDLSNLQRQIAFTAEDAGSNKARVLQQRLLTLNPGITIDIRARATRALLAEEVPRADVVLDCSDNFSTRYLINDACVVHQKPLISATVTGFSGQCGVFMPGPGQPCYRCVYPIEGQDTTRSCSETGIIAPLAGMAGAWQALEAIKLITGCGPVSAGTLLTIDTLHGQWQSFQVTPDPDCHTCRHLQK